MDNDFQIDMTNGICLAAKTADEGENMESHAEEDDNQGKGQDNGQ